MAMFKMLNKYKAYKEKIDTNISFDVFMKPSELVEFHENNVGTVVRKIDNNLSIYPHIQHFGCMLFFTRLTEQQIKDGPIVYIGSIGSACCF